MKIRSVTSFYEPVEEKLGEPAKPLKSFAEQARQRFLEAGYEVQSARLALPPLLSWLKSKEPSQASAVAQSIEQEAAELGINYVSLGPAQPAAMHTYELLPAILAATENVFVSGILSTASDGITLAGVKACAEVIHQAATISPDGFTNLRFAALANVEPGSPFLPAAYHAGGAPAFAIATEAADLAVDAFSRASNLEEARKFLVTSVEAHARSIERVANELAQAHSMKFLGIDFSLAPFPEAAHSMGTAIERLGVPAVGLHGSLAAAAIVMDAMERAVFPRTGFSGLFMVVLEDAKLARRAAEGVLSVKDILLYSAVCGTGLDTIPLPGDVTPEQLSPVLLDLAALAQRLAKPLTARLMPIPNKKAGDPTGFDFTFFANSKVMRLDSKPLRGPLGGMETYQILPRKI